VQQDLLQLAAAIQRKKTRLRCKRCGSADLWRVGDRSGLVAMIMQFRGLKPLQCRACGWVCYKERREKKESTLADRVAEHTHQLRE
jgi:ribosomal protein L37E